MQSSHAFSTFPVFPPSTIPFNEAQKFCDATCTLPSPSLPSNRFLESSTVAPLNTLIFLISRQTFFTNVNHINDGDSPGWSNQEIIVQIPQKRMYNAFSFKVNRLFPFILVHEIVVRFSIPFSFPFLQLFSNRLH